MVAPQNIESLPNAHNITHVELSNGITVLVYENHAVESVVIAGTLNAGANFDTPQTVGRAALAAAALMRGTQNRDFDAIHGTLEDIGADLYISSGRHSVSFSGKALTEDLPTLIDVLSDALRRPVFPDDLIEQLKVMRTTRLKYRLQDTRDRAMQAFRKALYAPEHPYHYSSYGGLATLPKLTPQMLRDFHAQAYTPHKMIMAVVGAVQTDAAVQMVRDALEDWHNPDAVPMPQLPTITPLQTSERTHATLPGKAQSDIIIGTAGASRFDTDYRAASIANSILGEFGMMGRVGNAIREQAGLAYYAYSYLDGGSGRGPWLIAAGVAPEDVDEAIAMAIDEARRITNEWVTEDELADNQAYFVGRLPLRLESNQGIAATLISLERFDLGLDYLLNYHNEIYDITREDVLHAAQHYINPDALVIATAGPA